MQIYPILNNGPSKEFIETHRSGGISVDLRGYISPFSSVLVRINGQELPSVSLRQYDAIYGLVLVLNRGKAQIIEHTAIDLERNVVRIQKSTFKEGGLSERSTSDYSFHPHGYLIRIDTNIQAYGADELQLALLSFLQGPTSQKVATIFEPLMRE